MWWELEFQNRFLVKWCLVLHTRKRTWQMSDLQMHTTGWQYLIMVTDIGSQYLQNQPGLLIFIPARRTMPKNSSISYLSSRNEFEENRRNIDGSFLFFWGWIIGFPSQRLNPQKAEWTYLTEKCTLSVSQNSCTFLCVSAPWNLRSIWQGIWSLKVFTVHLWLEVQKALTVVEGTD